MPNEIRGVDVLIKKDGTAIAGQRDCTLSFKGDKIDTSVKTNDGWKTALQGLKDWSISVDCVNYIGLNSAGQRALRKAFLDGDNVDIVAAVGDEEVYIGTASITGLDISGPLSDVSTSAFTLEGADALSYEFAPEFSAAVLSGLDKIVTISFSEDVLSNAADSAALKAGVTLATNGTTFAALAAADTVAITDGDLVVTLDSALTTATNIIKIAGSILKTTNGAIQTQDISTTAIDAS